MTLLGSVFSVDAGAIFRDKRNAKSSPRAELSPYGVRVAVIPQLGRGDVFPKHVFFYALN